MIDSFLPSLLLLLLLLPLVGLLEAGHGSPDRAPGAGGDSSRAGVKQDAGVPLRVYQPLQRARW